VPDAFSPKASFELSQAGSILSGFINPRCQTVEWYMRTMFNINFIMRIYT